MPRIEDLDAVKCSNCGDILISIEEDGDGHYDEVICSCGRTGIHGDRIFTPITNPIVGKHISQSYNPGIPMAPTGGPAPTELAVLPQEIGLYWHVHHTELFEMCLGAQERIDYIKVHKSKAEQDTRLKLMKQVRGTIGDPLKFETFEASARNMVSARNYYLQLSNQGKHTEAREYHRVHVQQAEETYSEDREQWHQTVDHTQAERLHKVECKNCPWNGQTIFPNGR